MAAHNHMTRAERVMREFQAKQRLLTSRPDVPIEPAELRELMSASDQAMSELADIRVRCVRDEEVARTTHRASSPLVGRRGGGVRRRALRRAEINQFRTTISSIDRSVSDLRKLQTSLRPTEIDLRDEQVPTTATVSDIRNPAEFPPPPARLGTTSDPSRRLPTEHEQAMLTWLAQTLHEVLANRDQPDWPAFGEHIRKSYGPPCHDFASPYAELQQHLLNSLAALCRLDQRTAIDELTRSYAVLEAHDGAPVARA